MKRKLFFLVMCLGIGFMYSQPRVSLEHNGTTTIYVGNSAFVQAFTAAVDGDFIYLPGGTFEVPSFDKKVTIIGAGVFPNATTTTGKTFINGVITFFDNADGLTLEGVEVSGSLNFANNHSINNVVIKRCVINGDVNFSGNLLNATNFSFIENVLRGSLNLPNLETGLFSNNIIQGVVRDSSGNMFQNNIFLHNDCGYYGNVALITGNNNTFQNNIFNRQCDNFVGGTGNRFLKNIFVMTASSFGTTPTLTDNYMNVSYPTVFVNQTGGTFEYNQDYHLQTPATYLGMDGSEVGVFGGQFPFKTQLIPENPHISVKNINPTTNSSGELQVEIKAEAQNH